MLKTDQKGPRWGETVPGFEVPVWDEREIRASAGILFLILFIALVQVLFAESYTLVKLGISLFFLDFCTRIFAGPRYSPSLILGRFIVRNQKKEYVGAAQKRFAWKIGLGISTVMFLQVVIANITTFVTGILCYVCLGFLFFEAAFGICLGCSVYEAFHRDRAKYCPGDSCDPELKLSPRRLGPGETAVFWSFVCLALLAALFLGDYFRLVPADFLIPDDV